MDGLKAVSYIRRVENPLVARQKLNLAFTQNSVIVTSAGRDEAIVMLKMGTSYKMVVSNTDFIKDLMDDVRGYARYGYEIVWANFPEAQVLIKQK